MNEEDRFNDLTDLYLRDELNAEERAEFEAIISGRSGLKKKISEDKETVEALRAASERIRMRKALDTIHSELYQEEKISVKKSSGKFFKIYYPTIATAAAVAALVVISTTLLIRNLGSIKQQQTENYVLLRRDLERIKESGKTIIVPNQGDVQAERFSGTGIAVASQGYIATGYHVVKNADSVYIENKTGRYKVDVVISDKSHDLAILKINDERFKAFSPLPYTLKNTDSEIGERVFTLGYPREDVVYGDGSVSALSGYEGDSTAYQISVPVNPGNSGGPLMNEDGDLIGLISGKHIHSDGAAFAVKARYLSDLFKFIAESTPEEKPYLPKRNSLKGLRRAAQLKKLEDFVFYVKIYEKK